MERPDAVVLAAGFSLRFGSDKLLFPYKRKPLILHTLDSVMSACGRVIVVVSGDRLAGLRALALPDTVRFVVNPRPEDGMFVSVKLGLSFAQTSRVFILPADCAFTPASVFFLCLDACSGSADGVVPTFGGRTGHPLLAGGGLVKKILESPDDSRLDHIAAGSNLRYVETGRPEILKDVDTRDDLKS